LNVFYVETAIGISKTPGSSVAACLWAPRVQALDELASMRSAEDAAILPSKKINIKK